MALSTAAKVGIGAAVLAVVAGGVAAVAVNVNRLWQGAGEWGHKLLGFGSSSIADGGCLLTNFTMAVNALRGTGYTPDQVNELLKRAGAFSTLPGEGSLIIVEKAAAALGLSIKARVRQDQRPTNAAIRAVVDGGLNAKGLAVVHVDHNGDGRGDHFVLVRGREKRGGYTAADPAKPTAYLPLSKELGSFPPGVKWGAAFKTYRAVGAFSLVVG